MTHRRKTQKIQHLTNRNSRENKVERIIKEIIQENFSEYILMKFQNTKCKDILKASREKNNNLQRNENDIDFGLLLF